MATISVRLPEGIYAAVDELAEAVGISKSDVATLVLFFGLANVKGNVFSQRTHELIQADTLESYGSFLRTMAKLTPEARTVVEKKLGDIVKKLGEIFPGLA